MAAKRKIGIKDSKFTKPNFVKKKRAKKVKPKKAKKKKPAKPIPPKKEIERLNRWYAIQLEEKDKMIDRLKKENSALLATALKQGAKTREIFERAKKAMEKKR